MLTSRNLILGIMVVIVGLFVYKFRIELAPLAKDVFNNLYISHLDTTDAQAVSRFIDTYKTSLVQNKKLSNSEIDRTLENTKKLLQQNKLAVTVGYNLSGQLVGYMAVDLKTGIFMFYYISYKGSDFSKIYKNLLQDLELLCKKEGLKTLIIPVVSPQIYQEDIPSINVGQNQKIEESIISVLQNLGYKPLQGWSKFKQAFKELFFTYTYDSAWSKNL